MEEGKQKGYGSPSSNQNDKNTVTVLERELRLN